MGATHILKYRVRDKERQGKKPTRARYLHPRQHTETNQNRNKMRKGHSLSGKQVRALKEGKERREAHFLESLEGETVHIIEKKQLPNMYSLPGEQKERYELAYRKEASYQGILTS